MDIAVEGSEEEIALKGIAPTEEQMRMMAHMCSLAAGGCKGSAKKLYEKDMLEIYHMAL